MHEIWLFGISALLSFFFGTLFTDESALYAPVTFATVASSGFWEFWIAFQTDADCSLGCFVNLLDVGYGPLLKFGLLSTQVVAAPRLYLHGTQDGSSRSIVIDHDRTCISLSTSG